MRELIADISYGLRRLRKDKGYACIAVIALALGIGANSAVLASVQAMLLRPLPFRSFDRIVSMGSTLVQDTTARSGVAPGDYADFARTSQSFEKFAAYRGAGMNLTGVDNPERLRANAVSRDFFAVLGVNAALGRTFEDSEFQAGRDRVVLVSHGFWQRRLASDAAIVGKTLQLNGRDCLVVGVIPEDYDFPLATDVWLPLVLTPEESRLRDGTRLSVIALMKSGVEMDHAGAEMNTLAAGLARQYPATNAGRGAFVTGLVESDLEVTRQFVLILLAAAVFVLLLACANVGNLQLARATSRQREVAIRMALGAGRWRIVQQMLTESVLLGLGGGVLGILLAIEGNTLMMASVPAEVLRFVPGLKHLHVDGRVALMTLGVAVSAGLLAGLASAYQACRATVGEALKEGGRGSSAGPARYRLRSLLVISEITLALVLLVCAGLMVRTFQRIADPKLGFDSHQLLTMHLALPDARYSQARQQQRYFEQALANLSTLAGVESATVSTTLPALQSDGDSDFLIEGHPAPLPGHPLSAEVHVIGENYLPLLRLPLVRGRDIAASDGADTLPVALISRTVAERYFHGEDAIGRRIHVQSQWVTIVGITGAVSMDWFFVRPQPAIYLPFRQSPRRAMYAMIRIPAGLSAEGSTAAAARDRLRAIDADQPIADVRMFDDRLGDAISGVRAAAEMMTSFALIAVLLAAAGVYAVMSYSVSQRLHEFGVRMALGARRSDLVALVMGQGLREVWIGLTVGFVFSFALAKAMSAMLYGLVAVEPLIFVSLAVLLTGVAAAASAIPARSASNVDPVVALRHE